MFVKTVDYRSPQAAEEFVSTLRETGFAVLSNHPISKDLLDSVYGEWQGFFESNEKFGYTFDPKTTKQAGYFPFKSENAKNYAAGDLKEFYHYWSEADLPKGLSPETMTLHKNMSALAVEILQWLGNALPASIAQSLSMPLHQMVQDSDLTLLRIIHYPPLAEDEEEGAVRSAEHEDLNIITILPAATQPGLQVKDSKGQWHEVPCDPGTLVFNAADGLQLATDGFYRSTTHRVVNPAGSESLKSRYSMPMFINARSDVQLSPTDTTLSFMEKRLNEIGLKSKRDAA